MRIEAIQVLANLLPDHADLRAAVAAKLYDEDVRAEAIQALANLLPDHADWRAAVAAKLDDEDSGVRAEAIRALANLLQTTPTCAPPSPPNSTMKSCAPPPSRR